MPFCPKCRQEFESFATACEDCEVSLVAELAAPTAIDVVAFVLGDDRARDYAVPLLQQAGVQLKTEPGASRGFPAGSTLLYVPAPMGQGVLGALAGDANLEEQEPPKASGVPILGSFRSAKRRGQDDAIHDAPLLKDPVALLVRRGESILPEIAELVRKGDSTIRESALAVAVAFGPVGRKMLLEMLPRLAKENRSEPFFAAAKVIRDGKVDAASWDPLVAIAVDPKSGIDARCLALHVIGRTEVLAFALKILDLLDDGNELIREAADEALCTLADDDMGFDPEMETADRKRVIGTWRKHLDKRGVR